MPNYSGVWTIREQGVAEKGGIWQEYIDFSIRAVFAGGYSASISNITDVMDYISINSTGNATDFGDLTSARVAARGASNTTRGCFMGGLETPGGNVNIIDFVTIGSTGNASDFGDIIAAGRGGASASNGHGGLVGG